MRAVVLVALLAAALTLGTAAHAQPVATSCGGSFVRATLCLARSAAGVRVPKAARDADGYHRYGFSLPTRPRR